eukprot:2947969-Rhodomonas_salina.1
MAGTERAYNSAETSARLPERWRRREREMELARGVPFVPGIWQLAINFTFSSTLCTRNLAPCVWCACLYCPRPCPVLIQAVILLYGTGVGQAGTTGCYAMSGGTVSTFALALQEDARSVPLPVPGGGIFSTRSPGTNMAYDATIRLVLTWRIVRPLSWHEMLSEKQRELLRGVLAIFQKPLRSDPRP